MTCKGDCQQGRVCTCECKPPSREWVGLSDDEIYEIINKSLGRSIGFAVEVTEEKLKAKNNG